MILNFFFTILFWASVGFIVYTYLCYVVLIYILSKIKDAFTGKKALPPYPVDWPDVTIVIAAYNEERFIEQKIKNTLQLSYPKSKLKIFIVTDGSDDHTPEI